MNERAYFYVSGCIFGLVAIAHLLRMAMSLPVLVGQAEFPIWISWGGLVIAGGLSVWALRLARGRPPA